MKNIWNRIAGLSGIVIVGGSAKSREYDCLASCEVLTNLHEGFINQTDILPGLEEPSRSPAVFSFNNKVIVVGGCSSKSNHLNSIRTLNTSNSSRSIWTYIGAKLCDASSCAAYCQFNNGTAFLAGGYNGLECLSDVSLLRPQCADDDKDLSVTALAPLSTRCKNGAALVTRDDNVAKEVRILGGWDEHRTLSSIFAYKMSADTHEFLGCSMVGVLPTALEGHTVTPIYNHSTFDAIICGGYDGLSVVSSLYTYKIDSGQTTRLLDVSLETARENHVAFCWMDDSGRTYFIVAGGWDGTEALQSCELFEIFDDPPFLRQECDQKLQLTEPRNRPGIARLRFN